MNGGVFTTESSTMTTTAGDVDGVNQEVSGELARLRGVVDGMAGEWKGQAKLAFDDVMLRWDEAAAKLRERLGVGLVRQLQLEDAGLSCVMDVLCAKYGWVL